MGEIARLEGTKVYVMLLWPYVSVSPKYPGLPGLLKSIQSSYSSGDLSQEALSLEKVPNAWGQQEWGPAAYRRPVMAELGEGRVQLPKTGANQVSVPTK